MRRRWKVNWSAFGALYGVWLVAWVVLAVVLKAQAESRWHGPESEIPGAPWWTAAACFAPLVIVGLGALVRVTWRWWRTDGWFVRREYEPVHDDLRERL
jgi:hypothetical protein